MMAKLKQALPIIGLILLALFIWVAGPFFAFLDYHPLEPWIARLILILLIVLAYAGSIVWKKLKAIRASDRLVAAVVQQAAADVPSPDQVALRERFEEAVGTLKARRTGQSLYDLPWYAIIGAPGSGKTTALVNSGLHFPLDQKAGSYALKGIGGTRNCDWWFTDEAVFLDTAGRYLTQDSDATADSAGWLEFLSLLRKYRKRRPLNGILLTISAQDLMQGSSGLESHIDAARRRLNELTRELRVQLPIYVMVTKTDLVSGFAEYFDDLTLEGRQQVWGVTFPYEQTTAGKAADSFASELDRLLVRVNQRVFERVEEDGDPKRRARVFAFPQQMTALRETLTQFITGVFTSTRFEQRPMLRGVYFTSGTQEGTPIDRILGGLSRRFGMAAEGERPAGRGKAYFIERFLKDVLFAESGLAGVNRRFEMQAAAAQLGGYVLMVGLAIVGVTVLIISYTRNGTYLTDVQASTAKLREMPPLAAGGSLDDALPRLDVVRQVSASANRFPDGAPWSMRWGLFQGASLGDAARDAYSRELDHALLPHIASRFRQRLIQYAPEPERLYAYLKAYLMLGNPEHLNKEQLEYLAGLEWQEAYAADPPRAAVVAQHLHTLLETNESLRPVTLDDTIIAQARNTLKQASLPGLIYRYVRIKYADDTARELQLSTAAGLGTDRVFRLRDGASLSTPIASIYTAPVFKEITSAGTAAYVAQFAGEYWVWGDAAPSIKDSLQLSNDFVRIYEDDYIAAWDRVVNGVQPAPLASLPATKEALAILGGATSPLRGLLKIVDDNTYLVAPPAPAKEAPASGALANLGALLPKPKSPLVPTVVAGQRVAEHFAPIHKLIAEKTLDGVIAKMGQLQQQLLPIGNEVGETPPTAQSMAPVALTATELMRDAQALPPGVAGVVTQLARSATVGVRSGATEDVSSKYASLVEECKAIVGARYPFNASATADVPPADFGRLFGYNGLYDTFFTANRLPELVDTTRSPWTWKTLQGIPVGGSPAMLRQFEAAQRIRQLYFRQGSQEPQLQFTITPSDLDAGALRFTLEIDGQTIDYRHAAPRAVAVTWPGPKPNLVVATFEERGGGRPNIVFEGPWAWLRMLARAQVTRESEVRYAMSIAQGGHEAKLTLEAPTLRNPYAGRDLQQFRCE
jgi:type VI secretion system protein ImpL